MLVKLNDENLLAETKKLVGEEKRITQIILEHLEEVQVRRLYALRGYSSMFEFCVGELGYSHTAANRRISAMRLIRDIPEAKLRLEDGSVNLSTLTQLHRFIRTEEKIKKTRLSPTARRSLLCLIQNKSQIACEREFAKLSPAITGAQQSIRPISEDLTEIKFMANQELMAKLDELRNRLEHKGVNRISELVEALADIALKKLGVTTSAAAVRNGTDHAPEPVIPVALTKYKSASALAGNEQSEDSIGLSEGLLTSGRPISRYIPPKLRTYIWRRDENCCQYSDSVTNRKCMSRYGLQIDHIVPFAKGGRSEPDNLRLLCRTHNQLLAMQNFSRHHMSKFIPTLK